MVFGAASVPYTSMTNLFNSLFVITVAAYQFSRGSFSVRQSIINVLKLPLLWAAIAAFIVHYLGMTIPEMGMHLLQMGAYTTMVLQLFILGVFLSMITISGADWRLITLSAVIKTFMLPLLAGIVIFSLPLPVSELAMGCLILQCFGTHCS